MRQPVLPHGEGTKWEGRNLYNLYTEAYTRWDWQPRQAEAAAGLGLDLFSTPFDDSAADFLEQVIGRRASQDVTAGTPLSWELAGGR